MEQNYEHIYTGSYPFRTDAKGRVSVPSSWDIEEGTVLLLSKKDYYGTQVLRVMNLATFNKFIAEISNRTDMDEDEKREQKGYFSSLVTRVTLGSQNKLQIPKGLGDSLGITANAEVVLNGRFDYFDIIPAEKSAMIEKASAEAAKARFGNKGFIG